MQQRQQDQQIRSQVRQFAIAPFILLPTGLDAGVVRGDLLLPASAMSRQGRLLLYLGLDCLLDQQHIAIPTGFEAVNLAAQACLSAIDASSIQKDRAAHLAVRLVPLARFQHGHRDQRPSRPSPIPGRGAPVQGELHTQPALLVSHPAPPRSSPHRS